MRSALLSAALEDACRQRVMVGRFPTCVLYLTLPYETVDVNVHPNKWEVRFADERGIRDAVTGIVLEALSPGAADLTPPPFFSAPPPDRAGLPPMQVLRREPEAASFVAEAGKFTVLDTALSVYFWNAACMRMWYRGEISWAQTKVRRTSSGISIQWATVPSWAIRLISSSL